MINSIIQFTSLLFLLGWITCFIHCSPLSPDKDSSTHQTFMQTPPPPQAVLKSPETDEVKLFQEAASDLSELATAYYSPAKDESTREKRTLGVVQNIANRTRSAFSSIRSLVGGGSGGGGSSSGFRTFFSNLLNRFLIFLTNLWDRITGFFRRDGSNAGSGGVLGRLTGLLSGGSGGGLFSIFRPTTTTESFFDSEFSYYSSTSSSTEHTPTDDHGSDNSISGETSKKEDKSDDGYIPFPGDSDASSRIAKSLGTDTGNGPSSFVVNEPHVVKSPAIIHVVDDGRRFVA